MRKWIGLTLLPLAGCSSVAAQDAPVATAPAGECSNEGLDRFKGQPATAELGAEMLRVSGAKRLQWIEDGMMVTMEFDASRLRVQLDANNRIVSVRCG